MGAKLERDTITPERWKRLKELFDAALEREPASRVSFLAQAAADVPTLADEVLGLLRSDEKANAFLSASVSPGFASTASLGVRRDGTAKILDFGLAKLASELDGQTITQTGRAALPRDSEMHSPRVEDAVQTPMESL